MKTLGDVIKIETGEQLNKSDMLPEAEHPVVNGGIDFSGFTDKYNCEANTITISQGGASAGYVNWLDQKFWAGAHCYVVTPLPDNDVRFLYHFIKSREYNFMKNQQGAGIPSLNRSEVYKTVFPEFEYKKQNKIAEILDFFMSMITNLETELASRQKQYEYYRNKLLTFDKDDESVEWKTLGEIAEIGTGSGNTNEGLTEGVYPFYTRGQEILRKNEYEYDESAVITAGDGVGVGKVIHYVNGKYALHQRAYRFCPVETVNVKYLYFYMKVSFYNYVCGNAVASSVSSLRKPKLKAYPIPIPTLSRQQEIVSILDTFESLTTNLKQEIELRKKQYEYYREQLLTFE